MSAIHPKARDPSLRILCRDGPGGDIVFGRSLEGHDTSPYAFRATRPPLGDGISGTRAALAAVSRHLTWGMLIA